MNNKKNFTISFTGIILLLCGLGSWAQGTKSLTLKEAIDLGIRNNKNLKILSSRIDEAKAVLQEANDARLPTFNVSGSYLRLSGANIDLKTKSNNSSNSNSGSAPSPNQAVYGIASISLPIYAGGRIRYGIESAKYLQKAVELDAERNADEVIYNTVQAYTNLYKSQKQVEIVKENLSASKSRDSSFSNLEKNGIIARNDLLKSQLQTSNVELTLLDAGNNYKLAMVNMNLMLGLPENDPIIIDSSFISEEINLKSFADYELQALQNRKDVQALDFREKAAATFIKSAKTEAYPTLALTGGYIAADIPKIITITNAVNFGMGVQYNLSSLWKKNTRLMQAQAREKQVKFAKDISTDAIRLQVNQDYQNLLLGKRKIEVLVRSNEQAIENYRITNNKYNNSLATITDLLDANVALLQSKLNIESAKADLLLAYQKLLQTTGTATR